MQHQLPSRAASPAQSITALAHLRAAVLYVIDISEQCGYTLKQQVGGRVWVLWDGVGGWGYKHARGRESSAATRYSSRWRAMGEQLHGKQAALFQTSTVHEHQSVPLSTHAPTLRPGSSIPSGRSSPKARADHGTVHASLFTPPPLYPARPRSSTPSSRCSPTSPC